MNNSNEKKPEAKPKAIKAKKSRPTNCESCMYYDYDEDYDGYVCNMELDEDEMIRFMSGSNQNCPYYRFYDEYKSVQKQN